MLHPARYNSGKRNFIDVLKNFEFCVFCIVPYSFWKHRYPDDLGHDPHAYLFRTKDGAKTFFEGGGGGKRNFKKFLFVLKTVQINKRI